MYPANVMQEYKQEVYNNLYFHIVMTRQIDEGTCHLCWGKDKQCCTNH